MSDVKLPDPMTYCKARMIDASLYGRNLESEMFGKIIDELARHNALVEAVAWERECCQDIRPLVAWADLYVRHGEDYVDAVADDLCTIQDYARAEVYRLIADCKGEG